MPDKLHLAILWHMHQPSYTLVGDVVAGMPWVRLHALKNYFDMPHLLEDYPGVRCVFNLVPSLWEQLERYYSGELTDTFLEAAMISPQDLSEDTRAFLLRNLFRVHPNLIAEFPRYAALDRRYRLEGHARCLRDWREQDYLDLQVLFHLAWSGWELRRDPLVERLLAKGHGYTQAEKLDLFAVQREFLARPIEQYRRLLASGQAEISTTPYYHPIIPLLLDLEHARDFDPQCPLPPVRFSHREDAALHLHKAREFVEARLEVSPRGMWPSEGAVTQEMLTLFRENNVDWLATDEEILWRSLPHSGMSPMTSANRAELLYRPWTVATERGPMVLYFRDREISDNIGFRYQTWSAEDAVGDIVRRLEQVLRDWTGKHPPLVSVILDGENAWEFYPGHGEAFLRLLYATLQEHPAIEMVTLSEATERTASHRTLPRLATGSWIYGNLRTWIGHPEKNRAWEYLAKVRSELGKVLTGTEEPEQVALVRESLLRAEGSDWFWWYGDDHHTEFAEEFDQLFRGHLRRAYELAGLAPPDLLDEPVRQTHGVADVTEPRGLLHPQLDGEDSHFFEWRDAGELRRTSQGTMHHGNLLIRRIRYGFDGEALFLRIDPCQDAAKWAGVGLQLKVPESPHAKSEVFNIRCIGTQDFSKASLDGKPGLWLGHLIEVRVPLSWIERQAGERFSLRLALYQDRRQIERWPGQGYYELGVPSADFGAEHWVV